MLTEWVNHRKREEKLQRGTSTFLFCSHPFHNCSGLIPTFIEQLLCTRGFAGYIMAANPFNSNTKKELLTPLMSKARLKGILWPGSPQEPSSLGTAGPHSPSSTCQGLQRQRETPGQRQPLAAAKMSYGLVNRNDVYPVRMIQAASQGRPWKHPRTSSRLPGTQKGTSFLSRGFGAQHLQGYGVSQGWF